MSNGEVCWLCPAGGVSWCALAASCGWGGGWDGVKLACVSYVVRVGLSWRVLVTS